jgi:ribose-phosphate pyrophosphokinase
MELCPHEERGFEDGEHKTRPLVAVRGKDVFVIHSLYGDERESVNDKLCRLLFFIGALKDAAAARVTAVVPYLCYARKDRKTKARDPVTTRYVAALLEAVGIDRIVTMDVHNLAAYQNAFRVPTEHLEARKLFVDYFTQQCGADGVVVVAPDAGAMKRAIRFQEALARRLPGPVTAACMNKQRSEGVVSGAGLSGEVAGKTAIVLDDLISSGTTLARAAQACISRGAVQVHAAATHGLFVARANQVVDEAPIARVVVTNTAEPRALEPDVLRRKVATLDISALLAEAILRMHEHGSLVDLLAL